jgi:hypothetical protein
MQTRSILMTSLLVGVIAATTGANAADSRDSTKDATTAPAPQRAMPDRDPHGGGMQGGGMMGGTQGSGMMGGTQGSGMMGGMQGGGMMGGMGGMMDMMNGCSQMMSGTATPHLPPGNEKLQLKMQAEIMQKTAEILSRYADQIGDGK